MSNKRSTLLLALALAGASLGVSACSDQSPTQPQATTSRTSAFAVQAPTIGSSLLSSIPVTQTLAGGNTLNGVLSITGFALQNGQLVATGTLTGTVTNTLGAVLGTVNTTFQNVAASLTSPSGTCSILTLSIGAIDLNLLGLVVNLAPINLDVHAQPGPGNLLGNLLCAVANLLNNGGPLTALQNLLSGVNNILAGLGV